MANWGDIRLPPRAQCAYGYGGTVLLEHGPDRRAGAPGRFPSYRPRCSGVRTDGGIACRLPVARTLLADSP